MAEITNPYASNPEAARLFDVWIGLRRELEPLEQQCNRMREAWRAAMRPRSAPHVNETLTFPQEQIDELTALETRTRKLQDAANHAKDRLQGVTQTRAPIIYL